MILAFADDNTVTVFDTVAQANVYCEGIDVENGVFIFTDERGYTFCPTCIEPNKKFSLFSLTFVSSSFFRLELTKERNVQLLQEIIQGRVWVNEGPTPIGNNEQLKEVLLKADSELNIGD